jgi:hypothetical protein
MELMLITKGGGRKVFASLEQLEPLFCLRLRLGSSFPRIPQYADTHIFLIRRLGPNQSMESFLLLGPVDQVIIIFPSINKYARHSTCKGTRLPMLLARRPFARRPPSGFLSAHHHPLTQSCR